MYYYVLLCTTMYYYVLLILNQSIIAGEGDGVVYTNLVANDDEEEKGNCRMDMPRLRNKKLQNKIPRLFFLVYKMLVSFKPVGSISLSHSLRWMAINVMLDIVPDNPEIW